MQMFAAFISFTTIWLEDEHSVLNNSLFLFIFSTLIIMFMIIPSEVKVQKAYRSFRTGVKALTYFVTKVAQRSVCHFYTDSDKIMVQIH